MDLFANRWREGGYRGVPAERVPLFVKEAFYGNWFDCFAWFPVVLVSGRLAWLRPVEVRRVLAPRWFMSGFVSWREYRERMPVLRGNVVSMRAAQ